MLLTRLNAVGVLLLASTLWGCTGDDSKQRLQNDDGTRNGEGSVDLPERRLIQELRSRVDGDLILVPYVNGSRILDERGDPAHFPFLSSASAVDVTSMEQFLTALSNDIYLEIIFRERQGYTHRIASSGVNGIPPATEGPIDLSGIFWIYEDQDGDELFNLEEIGTLPVDCDGDNLLTFEDSDSDNDGIIDGFDSSSNGPPCAN